MTTSFSAMFPELIEESHRLYDTFSIIASVIVFGGLCMAASEGSFGDLGRALRGLLTAALVVVVIGIFPRLTDLLQQMAHSLVTDIHADPSESHRQFANLIMGPEADGNSEAGMWDILWADKGGFGKAVLYAVVLMFGKLAFAIMWLATLIQNLIMLLGVAVAPVFLAMITVEFTRGIAGRYFLTLTSTICWPLGWAVADVVTKGLLGMASGIGILSIIVILSLWIPFSAIAAPIAITKLLASGSQIGASLLQGVGMAVSQGTSYAVGAGVTTSLGGGGRLASGAAAIAAGAGGMASGATGNSGVLIPGIIGTAAVMASSKDPEKEAARMANELRKSS